MARKEYKIHYIYKTTCKVTGKFYIGMHSTFNEDDSYIGSGKRLWHSIRKHGKENHVKEIIEYCLDRSSLKVREKEIVNEDLLNDKMCMNLQLGGGGGFSGEEHMKKCSQAGGNKTAFNRKCNIDLDNNFRLKASISAKNAWKDEEYRKSVIKGISGEKNGFYGKQHTKETQKKNN